MELQELKNNKNNNKKNNKKLITKNEM